MVLLTSLNLLSGIEGKKLEKGWYRIKRSEASCRAEIGFRNSSVWACPYEEISTKFSNGSQPLTAACGDNKWDYSDPRVFHAISMQWAIRGLYPPRRSPEEVRLCLDVQLLLSVKFSTRGWTAIPVHGRHKKM